MHHDLELSLLLEHLPGWVRWLDVAAAALLVGLAVGLLGTAVHFCRIPVAAGAHWTERARCSWPQRVCASRAASIGAVVVAALLLLTANPLSVLPPGPVAAVGALLVHAAGVWRCRRVEQQARGLDQPPRLGRGVAALTVPTWGLVAAMALLLPAPSAPVHWVAWGTGTLLYLWVARGGLLRQVLRRGEPPSAKLQSALAPARDGQAEAPRIFQRDGGGVAQAWALIPMRAVLFTDAAVEALTPQQLRGVYRHELAHLGEPWPARAARAALLLPLWLVASWRPLLGLIGPLPLIAALVAALLLILVLQRLGRRLESRADGVARDQSVATGEDVDYAHALEVIYQLNAVPAVLPGKGTTHPHLHDRLVALGVEPAYPRPQPPPRLRIGRLRVALLLIVAAFFFVRVQPFRWLPADHETALLLRLGIESRVGGAVRDLARHHVAAGRVEAALPFARWSANTDPNLWTLDLLAHVLTRSGARGEARAVLDRIDLLLVDRPGLADRLPYRVRTLDLLGSG